VKPQPLNSREITPLPNEERGKWDFRAGLEYFGGEKNVLPPPGFEHPTVKHVD
jgi:hypothetical protein